MMRQNGIDKTQLFQNEVRLLSTLHRLWNEHVLWTRAFILSTALDLGDQHVVTERLLRNAADLANVFRPMYGDEAAKTFESLMAEHLLTVAQLVSANKADDQKAIEEQREKWYANANAIAGFLSEINPYWDKAAWKQLLYIHLNRTEYEIMQLLTGQYTSSIVQYDGIQNQALDMAEYLAYGIMKQFPMHVANGPRSNAAAPELPAVSAMAMQPLQFSENFLYPQNLEVALALMQQEVADEYEDRMLYAFLIENAPSEEDRQLIEEIRDNEIDHFNLLRQLYFSITGRVIPQQQNGEFTVPKTYCEGVKNALLSEDSAVQKYRRILYAMQPGVQTNVMLEILTDEIRHGNLYSYLYAKNGCDI